MSTFSSSDVCVISNTRPSRHIYPCNQHGLLGFWNNICGMKPSDHIGPNRVRRSGGQSMWERDLCRAHAQSSPAPGNHRHRSQGWRVCRRRSGMCCRIQKRRPPRLGSWRVERVKGRRVKDASVSSSSSPLPGVGPRMEHVPPGAARHLRHGPERKDAVLEAGGRKHHDSGKAVQIPGVVIRWRTLRRLTMPSGMAGSAGPPIQTRPKNGPEITPGDSPGSEGILGS